ncbi:MAG: hypothetical protein IJ835_00160 [Muribaculaceae bacterium]|nr:hypothetical protein [Muribaculaceae bacterium]
MKTIKVDNRILDVCSAMRVGVVAATVVNSETGDELWHELEQAATDIASTYQLLEINRRPAIAAARKLYKAFGKDPGRYRVASEALCRRIIRGLGLYRTTTLIDLVNLVSIKSGYPIGGFDADKIVGDTLTLGIGEPGEQYNGIGRGALNIEGMPVYRDDLGAMATPTSDEERIKFTPATRHIQLNINAFDTEMPLERTIDWTVGLLRKYASATDIQSQIFTF